MFKFERKPDIKKEEDIKKEKTILQKIRENSKLGKGELLASIVVGGLGVGINNAYYNYNKYTDESINFEKENVKFYDVNENTFITDTMNYLNDNFVSEVALELKKKSILDDVSFLDENYYSIYIKTKEEISKEKYKLTDREKEIAREKIIDIISLIENIKLEIIMHLEDKNYLLKISNEMNIPVNLAKEHVMIRINNVKNISYDLVTKDRITKDLGTFANGYYLLQTNKVVIAYDSFILHQDIARFKETIMHEILHESTMGPRGLSNNAKYILNESSKKDNYKMVKDVSYNSDNYLQPEELMVRKQILDLYMDKNGIKKYGDKFTIEHYNKLLELKENGNLDTKGGIEFIDNIKEENFVRIMNELADNISKEKGDYYNPQWDYKENQT